MQQQQFLSRWMGLLGLSVVLMALTACQPIRPSQGVTLESVGAVGGLLPLVPSAQDKIAAEKGSVEASAEINAKSAPQQTEDSEEVQALIEEGLELFAKSDLEGAEQAFQDAIDANQESVAAHLGLIDVYLYQPQFHQQAIDTAEAAVELAPEDPAALARLSWAYQGVHKFEDAKEAAEKAVEFGEDSSVAHVALADILNAVYEVDASYEAAQKAVELDPDYASAWATLGGIAFGLEKWNETGDAYARALELEPDFFLWQILRARYEFDTTGDAEATRDLAQSAIDALPKHAYVLSLLVDLAIDKNDWKLAEDTCKETLELNTPDTVYPDAYTCMVGVNLLQEKYKDAEKFQDQAEEIAWPERRDITVFRMRLFNDKDNCDDGLKLAEEWLEERSFSVSAMRMVGAGYLCKEDFAKAIEFFKQAVDKLPLSLADARLLANAYARDGKESDALKALRKFSKLSAGNPLYYQALYEVYLFLGKPKDAIKQAQRWQVLRPESTDAKVSLALGFLFDNNVAAAQDAAEQALEAGASDSTIYAVLGETYHRAGDPEKAEEFLMKSLEINEDNFLAHNYLATLYLVLGDCEKAVPQLEWLQEKMTDEEQLAQIAQLIEGCASGNFDPGNGSNADPGDAPTAGDSKGGSSGSEPSASTGDADRAAVSQARAFLRDQGVRVRTARFEEDGDDKILVVVYTARIDADTDEFTDLEMQIAYGLASLLPDMDAKPTMLSILSSANDKPQNYIVITTEAATLWMDGLLTDEEFEEGWLVEKAE